MSRSRVISIDIKNNFKKTSSFLNNKKNNPINIDKLRDYGYRGVEVLKAATPKRTGLTSESWYYEIKEEPGKIELIWCNSNIIKDYANVAILIQYGHATRNGGYVQGIDYINPALKPIFQELANSIYEEVKR